MQIMQSPVEPAYIYISEPENGFLNLIDVTAQLDRIRDPEKYLEQNVQISRIETESGPDAFSSGYDEGEFPDYEEEFYDSDFDEYEDDDSGYNESTDNPFYDDDDGYFDDDDSDIDW